jgi:glycosyltransferase involved in cell wall biosynthesis
MKVGISSFAGDAGKSGISQYMINIFKRLPELSGEDEYVLFMTRSDREYFETGQARVKIVAYPDWIGSPVVNILWHLIWLPIALAKFRCDCVFMPAGNRRLGWWYGVPSISTVHDLSQLHVEGKYDPFRMFYIKRVLPRMMKRLDHIAAVSKATRRDLVTHVGIDPECIDVVYNGAELESYQPRDKTEAAKRVRQQLDVDTPYILYTARLEHPGKNHVRLIKAFAQLKKESNVPHQLVLAGSPWYGAEAIYAAVRSFGVEQHVCFPGFVPNAELPSLYAGADLFVFPSLFEGFGIPLLEAMASGIPLCASNVASIPEVVRDAGLLFDPANTDEIQQAMATLLADKKLSTRLVKRGIHQASLFSWDDSARQLLSIIHAVSELRHKRSSDSSAKLIRNER